MKQIIILAIVFLLLSSSALATSKAFKEKLAAKKVLAAKKEVKPTAFQKCTDDCAVKSNACRNVCSKNSKFSCRSKCSSELNKCHKSCKSAPRKHI